MQIITFLIPCLLAILPGSAQQQNVSQNSKQRIYKNLKHIEDLYISKLDFTERREAIALMNMVLNDLGSIDGDNPMKMLNQNQILSPEAFKSLLSQIKSTIDDTKKLSLILVTYSNSSITSHQLDELLAYFSFEGGRVDCIKQIYPRIADKQNIVVILKNIKNEITKNELLQFFKAHY